MIEGCSFFYEMMAHATLRFALLAAMAGADHGADT